MLNRKSIGAGAVYELLREHQDAHNLRPTSEAERAASLAATLAAAPPGALDDGAWVFGYGSLLWNPAFDYRERRRGHPPGQP